MHEWLPEEGSKRKPGQVNGSVKRTPTVNGEAVKGDSSSEVRRNPRGGGHTKEKAVKRTTAVKAVRADSRMEAFIDPVY